MTTPDLTPEKIEQGRKLLQRLKDYSCYERVRTQWHGDGNHNLAVDIQSVIAAAELGMAWEAEAKAARNLLHIDMKPHGYTVYFFDGACEYQSNYFNARSKTDQLTGRIGQ